MEPYDSNRGPSDRVVVTRFECRTFIALLIIIALHHLIAPYVRRDVQGHLGALHQVNWRKRTVMNVSLWTSIDAIYSMGRCDAHIVAARIPRRLGVATSCAIFRMEGDWRSVMFGRSIESRSILSPVSREL